jgi:hypothetical protein
MTDFVAVDTTPADVEALKQDVFAQLAIKFPGWEPADANLETWLVEALCSTFVDLRVLTADVSAEVFKTFGETLLNLPAEDEQFATGVSTWTMIDNAGYTVPAGTTVSIEGSGDETYAFEVQEDVVVAPGSTATGAGEVLLVAVVSGAEANDLTADPTLIDALAFVDSIVLDGTTSGGADPEDDTTYLNRLAAEVQLFSPRPIIPSDFEVLAKTVPGVVRATAVDGYNPGDASSGNERMIALALTDAAGEALSAPVKSAVDALLEAKREVNFVVNIMDANYTTIDIQFTAKALSTYDKTLVHDSVVAALQSYLSPANWGQAPGIGEDPGTWLNTTKVRYLEVAEVINRVDGVDYIETLQTRVAAGSYATTDITLTGAAPLTRAGSVTGTID